MNWYDRAQKIVEEAEAKGLADELGRAQASFGEKMRAGIAPRDAREQIHRSFFGPFAELLREAFEATLILSLGRPSSRPTLIGPVAVSAELFEDPVGTGEEIRRILRSSAGNAGKSAQELAREIFEGYGFRDREVLRLRADRPLLPEWLDGAVQAFLEHGDESALQRARECAARHESAHVRAAYHDLLTVAAKRPKPKVLAKRRLVAWSERVRFYAERIVQFELSKAHSERKAFDFQLDPVAEFIQVRDSEAARPRAICALLSRGDFFGLGPGVYPREQAPRPPFCYGCACIWSLRLDLRGQKPRPGAGVRVDEIIKQFPVSEVKRLLGVDQSGSTPLSLDALVLRINAERANEYRIVELPTAAATYATRLRDHEANAAK